jgi:hypothetical protein
VTRPLVQNSTRAAAIAAHEAAMRHRCRFWTK